MPHVYCSLKAYCTTLLPPVLDIPTSASRCLHTRNDARDPSSERWNCADENIPVILPEWRLSRHSGVFYMPQIYDMRPTALLPLRRKACWGFFRPEKSWRLRPRLNPRTWVPKASTLPLDHRSRFILNVTCFLFYSLQLINTRSCNYSCTSSWWWVSTPETYRAAYRNIINGISRILLGSY